jgi:hypothetical protein
LLKKVVRNFPETKKIEAIPGLGSAASHAEKEQLMKVEFWPSGLGPLLKFTQQNLVKKPLK